MTKQEMMTYLQSMYDKGFPVCPASETPTSPENDVSWFEDGVFYCYRTAKRNSNRNIEFFCYPEGTHSDDWWIIKVEGSDKLYFVEKFESPLDTEFDTFDSALLYLRMSRG